MAKFSRGGRGRARARQSARTGALEVFVRPDQTIVGRIISWMIRLRAEIFVITCITLGSLWLSSQLPEWAFYLVLIAVCAVLLGVPAIRRYVTRRCWCVITRHRVRACFEQTRTMTHDGKCPSLLWARPTPVGERVRVWLPAGLSVNDLERVTENIAVACYAQNARIERGNRAFLVSIVIIRRDSLGHRAVRPDVLGSVDPIDEDDPTNVVRLPRREDVLTDLAATNTTAGNGPGESTNPTARGGKKSRNETNGTEPVVRGFGGMDVSDYV